jgi:hypothetical protein
MDFLGSLIRYPLQTNRVAPAAPSHEALSIVPDVDTEPEYQGVVAVDDIFSELEACRKSAMRNLESYLDGIDSLISDTGAPETDAGISPSAYWRTKIG